MTITIDKSCDDNKSRDLNSSTYISAVKERPTPTSDEPGIGFQPPVWEKNREKQHIMLYIVLLCIMFF